MFSDKIRELMIERDISLTDLAELSGVPFETLRNIYYRKVKDPKVSTAFQLASALEVTVEYLLKDMSTTEEEAENSEGQEGIEEELLENYRFKYDTKHQFLGDFFEELLNTSLKQEAGQFFTPYPIVDFMVDSLPYEKLIKKNVDLGRINFIPSVIDYACGAGHFLISSMAKTQEIIKK